MDKSGVCRTAVECDERSDSEHKSALARAFSTRLWVVYFLSRRRRGRRPPASQVVTRHSGPEDSGNGAEEDEDPKDSRFVLARSRRAGCVGASQLARSGGPRSASDEFSGALTRHGSRLLWILDDKAVEASYLDRPAARKSG